jgi:hypothetical protein
MSTINRGRATKRRRHNHHHGFAASSASHITSNEERLLHQAIQNSKLASNTRNGKVDVPWGPTFYPTKEEMEGSPLDYIDKIRPIAQRYGICKIVPPKGWSTDFFGECSPTLQNSLSRLLRRHALQIIGTIKSFPVLVKLGQTRPKKV